MNTATRARRAFTVAELLLSLAILVFVGLGIAGLLAATASAIDDRSRFGDPTVLAALARTRVDALTAGARCVLGTEESPTQRTLVLWLDDARPSATPHASELGYLRFDRARGTLWLDLPDPSARSSPTALAKRDPEIDSESGWQGLNEEERTAGLLQSEMLYEGLADVRFEMHRDALRAESFVVKLELLQDAAHASRVLTLPFAFEAHEVPVR
ncbi:MAG: hypothetical protein EXS10_08720 [Phycisphaerales bacterium]|nr:hypothetical protein [Phycisphaerales bacterium]